MTDASKLSPPDDSAYWTKQRCELIRWLDDRAPSFKEGYIAAVHLVHAASFPARVHLVCHVVRDIYRGMPAVLGAQSQPRAGEVLPNMVKTLAERWKEPPPHEVQATERSGASIVVGARLYDAAAKLVERSIKLADQPTVGKMLAIALFRSLDRRAGEFIDPWIIDSFDGEYGFFVQRAHLAMRVDRVHTDDCLIERFEAFERAFHSLVGPYFSGKDELDAILQDTNTPAD